MSGVIISGSGLVITEDKDTNGDNPIIGYQNLVTTTNVSASTSDSQFPVTNLANVITSTPSLWFASNTGEQHITVVLNTVEQVDYLAIAKHNFGSGAMIVSVEGNAGDGVSSPQEDWFTLVSDAFLVDDGPAIFRFTPQSLYAIRLRIQSSQAAVPLVPQLGILYVGKLLVLQRRIYVGHTPMPMGRKLMLANQMAMSGDFLGRIVLGQTRQTAIALTNLTASWYRANMEPFLKAAQEIPFFVGWRPATYPAEAGFAWLTDDPIPDNQRANGMMEVTLNLQGLA